MQKEIRIKAAFESTDKTLEGAATGIANILRATADIGIDSGQITFNRQRGERILEAQIVPNEGTPEGKIETLKGFLENELKHAKNSSVIIQKHDPHAHLKHSR